MVPLEYEEEIFKRVRLEMLTLNSLWRSVNCGRGRVQSDALSEITVIIGDCIIVDVTSF